MPLGSGVISGGADILVCLARLSGASPGPRSHAKHPECTPISPPAIIIALPMPTPLDGNSPISLDALESAVRAADPAALLVPPWLLQKFVAYDRGPAVNV